MTGYEREDWEAVRRMGDGHLHARSTDPETSHKSAAQTEETEGADYVVKGGTKTYEMLVQYRDGSLLTDAQAAESHQAGYGYAMICPWRKASSLRQGGFIEEIDVVHDSATGREVMRCQITHLGVEAINHITGGAREFTSRQTTEAA